MDFTDNMLIAQIVGYIGLFFGIASYQLKQGKHIIGSQVLMATLWVMHYYFMGAYEGAIIGTIAIVRCAIGYFIKEKHLIHLAISTSIASVVLGVWTAASWLSATATMGSIFNNFSVVAREKTFTLRILQVLGEGMWLIYCSLILSWPCIFFGTFLITSNIIGAIRHEKDSIKRIFIRRPK